MAEDEFIVNDSFILEIQAHPFLFWIACSAVAGLIEVLIPSFSFIFFAIASVPAALISLKWGWPLQIGVFFLGLAGSILTLRKFFISKLHPDKIVHSRVGMLLGKSGKVIEAIPANSGHGRVLVEGQDWAASSHHALAIGQNVQIEDSEGIVLKVRKI